MFDCHYQKWDSLKSIWLLILDSVSCGLGWYWGFGFGVAFFYSWLGMSSIQHEIFIESIYNNQKLSILREYSITSCDHQTIFSCFYSPFYRSVWRSDYPSSDWTRVGANQLQVFPFKVGWFSIIEIFPSLEFRKIFLIWALDKIFISTSGFLDNEAIFFGN